MKALFYTGTQQTEIRDTDAAIASDGEVIVDLSYCGLCGSDMHAWHGHDERRIPPLILGHEAVGIARDGAFAGKAVAINPLMACGDCSFCHSGREHLCPDREMIGMRRPGGFAEEVAVRQANLSLLPDNLSLADAALAEPLACAVHAVSLALSHPQKDKHHDVVVLGGGAIGMMAALVFRHHGFTSLKVAETNQGRRDTLQALGGMSAYDPITEPAPASSADIVLDAVGSQQTRKAACEIVRPGGNIIHIGLQDNFDGVDSRRLTLQESTFQGTYCYQNHDFAEAINLLATGAVSSQGWTQIRPLDEGGQSFWDVHNGTAPPKIILQCR